MRRKSDVFAVFTTVLELAILPFLPFINATCVMWVNIHISLISVVFATGKPPVNLLTVLSTNASAVWNTGRAWRRESTMEELSPIEQKDLRLVFRRPPLVSSTASVGSSAFHDVYRNPSDDVEASKSFGLDPSSDRVHTMHTISIDDATLLERIETLESEVRRREQENQELRSRIAAKSHGGTENDFLPQ
jgi:hypothetical protein